jgi:tetratricopeptide (TPR) repeat protein
MAAALHTNLGIIDHIQENKDGAKKHLKNALHIYKELGNNKRFAEVGYNIGMTYFESKDYEKAIAAFDEGIQIAKDGMFVSILCLLYLAKSQVLIEKDEIKSASIFVDKAFEISHNVDDKLTLADIYKVKGVIEKRQKNFKLAESYLLNSLRINNSVNNDMNIAETSLELATLYNDIDGYKSKKTYLNNALNFYKQINALQKVNEIEVQLGMAAV